MSVSRIFATLLITLSAVSIGGSKLAAQSSTSGNALLVPVTGVADLGGMFSGAFIVERFAQQGNGVVAMGTVTGALIVNGTVRNLVVQTALPVDVSASRARLNTDAALARASCDVLHVELGSASINVLGSTLGFNPIAFDITAATTAVAAGTTSSTGNTATGNTAAFPATGTSQPGMPMSAAPGTVTPSVSTNTTQATPATPSTRMQLGPLLCAVNGFKNASDPAQLVQQLNGILTALAVPNTGS
jgi:hypothetical protein